MNKKVSIVIPIYNIEKYLRESVDSVLRQTYVNLDIILVDDGSVDSCPDICDEYAVKDNRVRVIHKENGGLSEARNAGLSLADGEYVYFLDGDDYIKPDAIEKLVKVIDQEKSEIVCFEWKTVYEDFNDPDYKEEFKRDHIYSTDKGSLLFELMLKNNEFFVPVPIQFYSTAFLKKNNLHFKKGIMHEDELFTPVAFIRAERVACINEQLYCRRLRANSIMSKRVSLKSIEGLIGCVEGFIDEISNYQKESLEYRLLKKYVQITLYNIFDVYFDFNKDERKMINSRLRVLRRKLSKSGYLGSFKVYLKVSFPSIIHIYNQNKIKS